MSCSGKFRETMHILFVTPMLPSVTSGVSTRTFNLIKQLATEHEVSVISFIQPSELDMLPSLEPYCHRIELVPFEGFVPLGRWRNRLQGWWQLLFDSRPQIARTFPVERMRRPLERLVQTLDLDVVHFESLSLVESLPTVGDLPVVLSEQNVEFEIARRKHGVADNPIHRVRDQLAWKKLRVFEAHWIKQFSVCLAVSKRDADILRVISGHPEFYVVPNGVDSAFFAPPNGPLPPEQGNIIFVGTMNYRPNIDGVTSFCREVWPLILQASPNITFTVVGASPAPEVVALQDLPGVTVTGFVNDVRPYFWGATASVVPLRIGSGTRLKILESLAAGCPVVSTTIGAEGLELEPGADLLVADNPEEFAACTVQLLTSRRWRDQLAIHGQQTVKRLYDWKIIAHQLEKAYQSATSREGVYATN